MNTKQVKDLESVWSLPNWGLDKNNSGPYLGFTEPVTDQFSRYIITVVQISLTIPQNLHDFEKCFEALKVDSLGSLCCTLAIRY